MTSKQELETAIAAWLQLAEDEDRAIELGITYGSDDVFRYRANLYRRTAKALQYQLDTGIAICVCCFKPLKGGKVRIFAEWGLDDTA